MQGRRLRHPREGNEANAIIIEYWAMAHRVGVEEKGKMDFMYLESQIVSINMNVYCRRIHIRIGTPVPFHEFDTFYLLFTSIICRINERRAMW